MFWPPIRTPSGWATAKRIGKAHLCDYIQDNHHHINIINNELQIIHNHIIQVAPDLTSYLRQLNPSHSSASEFPLPEVDSSVNGQFAQ